MENVSPAMVNAGAGKSVEDIYQKKTQLEHILLRPDMYLGSVEKTSLSLPVYDTLSKRMVVRPITYVPGLYKIFDEILVNAADNKQRDPKGMTMLKVQIDEAKGEITVTNNGAGIPIKMHQKEKTWVPDLIFGHLLTGSNYDDSVKKTTGGRNGLGAKITNIYSSRFEVELCDGESTYQQVWSNNLSKSAPPVIAKAKGAQPFTTVRFRPDFARFGLQALDADHIGLFSKRVVDIAGTTDKSLKVYLNGELIKTNTFQQYIQLYVEEATPVIHEKFDNGRWEIALAPSDGHFAQVSFVNQVWTLRGGTHVKAPVDQITDAVLEFLKKKHKAIAAKVKPQHVKNQLFIFVNCLVENPVFDAQTKECLTTTKKNFGSDCTLSDKFIKSVCSSSVIESILSWAEVKNTKDMKKTDGKKTTRISGITKLDDANHAGGKYSSECTLILTEGDSAKALAVSGLSVVGRDRYGVFPLKGKVLNVRDCKPSDMEKNEEIANIKKILGLKQGVKYTDTKSLRYGHVMIMTDQDHDGSHIKGLLVNLFSCFWPTLLRMPGFLTEFITPIVKCTRGKSTLSFFTVPEYENWKKANNAGKGWKIKYYKGLGTSTDKEAKEYFSNIERHQIDFAYKGPSDDQLIDLAFNKKQADARKNWIAAFEPGTFLDMNTNKITYTDFINKELVLFSIASNLRAIPSLVDGLKPGQRKILFSCFKRKLTKEIKVAQLAGYVSEHSAYHHGEASLCGTIVAMAQNFTGTNNINLLFPSGQFGTRSQGGKDAASPRYIYTYLCAVARAVFNELDDNLLKYLDDDGKSIEPEWYMPILPMVLVNGSSGIGTGWSSDVPNHNPRDIVANLKRLMRGLPLEPMHPWYKGYRGKVLIRPGDSYVFCGAITKSSETSLQITELPIGKWTFDYKVFLEKLMTEGFIKDFKEHHANNDVFFTVELTEEKMREAEAAGLEKKFKLTAPISTSNMVLFDAQGKLKRYDTTTQILEDFYPLRLKFYDMRKQHLLEKLTREHLKLQNRERFIKAVVNGELVISKKKKDVLIAELRKANYTPFPKETKPAHSNRSNDEEEDQESEEEEAKAQPDGGAKDYDYLLSMPLWSLTLEKVEELKAEAAAKLAELKALQATTPMQMWERDLDEFLVALEAHEKKELASLEEEAEQAKGKGKKKSKPVERPALMVERAAAVYELDTEHKVRKPRKKADGAPAKAKKGAKAEQEDDDDDMDEDGGEKKAKQPKAKKPKAEKSSKSAATEKAKSSALSEYVSKLESKVKQEASDAESEVDVDDMEVDIQPIAATREKRARKAISYVEDKDQEDEDDEDDMEEPAGENDDDDDDWNGEQDEESDYDSKSAIESPVAKKKPAARKPKADKEAKPKKAKAKAPKEAAPTKVTKTAAKQSAKEEKTARPALAPIPTQPKPKAASLKDLEPMSLADRLAARLKESKPSQAFDVADDEEDDLALSEDNDEEDDYVPTPKAKKSKPAASKAPKAAATKAAKPAAAPKAAKRTHAAQKADAHDDASPAPKRAKKPAKQIIMSDDDDEAEEKASESPVAAAEPPRDRVRRAAAAKVVKYQESDGEEEDEDDDFMEEDDGSDADY